MSQLLQTLYRPTATPIDGTLAPDSYFNGLPLAGGVLAVDLSSAIDHYHQGLPFTANSRLAVSINQPISHFGSGAAPFDAAGRLVTSTVEEDKVLGGVPYFEDKVSVVITGAPLNTSPFSDGFDTGFEEIV